MRRYDRYDPTWYVADCDPTSPLYTQRPAWCNENKQVASAQNVAFRSGTETSDDAPFSTSVGQLNVGVTPDSPDFALIVSLPIRFQ